MFQLDVIGTEADDGSRVLHVRWRENIIAANSLEIGTLHLLFLDDNDVIDQNSVEVYLTEFYDMIGMDININRTFDADATVFEVRDIDAIAFYGVASKILLYAAQVFGRITEDYGETMNSDFTDFAMPSSGFGEIAFGSWYCFIRTNNEFQNGDSRNEVWDIEKFVNEYNNYETYIIIEGFRTNYGPNAQNNYSLLIKYDPSSNNVLWKIAQTMVQFAGKDLKDMYMMFH